MTKGIVFNIQKFSIHDGPGIRTTVFLKGCPLRCKWCANPESQLERVQILYDQKKCVSCQTCVHVCEKQAISFTDKIEIDISKCGGCLQCVNHCPQKALSFEGEYKDVQTIVDTCMQDIDFYEESGGGITISGGEGMAQPEFLKALVPALKEHNLHVAIETTGYIEEETFKELAPMFDLLLFDVKQADTNKHFTGTGVYNEQIKENLTWAVNQGIEVLPRIPVIPGFNAALEDAKEIAEYLLDIGLSRVQLLPFHQMGERKYELLNREYELKNIKALYPEDLKEYQSIFVQNGVQAFF
ncbi:MAG: glycyl-radical enzyme activating protein [Bacillota bacterium]|nr:glycyl-radical enzyme activating protein [Bacillota bacterium]